MAENSRITKENRRLTTNMNVPLIDEILYVKALRNKNIPYDIRNRQFDNQNSKTQKLDIPPRCSSLTKNCKITTVVISVQLSSSRNKLMTPDNAFRQRSPPTPTIRQNWFNLTHEYVDSHKTKERFSQTYRQVSKREQVIRHCLDPNLQCL